MSTLEENTFTQLNNSILDAINRSSSIIEQREYANLEDQVNSVALKKF